MSRAQKVRSLLAGGGARAVGNSDDVLGRLVGVTGLLGQGDNTTVLSGLNTDSLENWS